MVFPLASYLKWAMMWANHDGPGSHSLEDRAKVTKYWIDNYFNTPEYYCIALRARSLE